MKAPSVIWFRNDLRTHDHAALFKCGSIHQPVLGVFCFDSSILGATPVVGLPKASPHRKRFLVECVLELRSRMRKLGSDLVIKVGDADQVIPDVLKAVGAGELHFQTVPGVPEATIGRNVRDAAEALGVEVNEVLSGTLIDPDDLPTSIKALPNNFSQFRKLIESDLKVRRPIPEPTELVLPDTVPQSDLLPEFAGVVDDPRSVLKFKGGEKAAALRLKNYFWDKDRLKAYSETRNKLLGEAYSTKLSPWLSSGSISARSVMREILWYEEERVKNESTYSLFLELLWRDFFQFSAVKFGPRLFSEGGTRGVPHEWMHDKERFAAWQQGRTGFPLIDANMTELAATGFISNRGRELVANFLTKNLGIDWRWGAEWFESCLIDHDAAMNYGNWQYQAGVGSDSQPSKGPDIGAQGLRYDPKAEYVKKWLPQLAGLSAALAHEPYRLGDKSPYYAPLLSPDWSEKTSA